MVVPLETSLARCKSAASNTGAVTVYGVSRVAPRSSGASYLRDDGLEFERVSSFTDAVYAIAMTLLVFTIAEPVLKHRDSADEMLRALRHQLPHITVCFIGFAILAFYWISHHQFVGRLRSIDRRFIAINLVYLAFVVALPFPTALLGDYIHNPVAVSLFAIDAAIISGCEGWLLYRSHRAELFREPLPENVYRYAMKTSLLPIVFFVISVPLAFVNTYVAIAVWFGEVPFEYLLAHNRPAESDAYFR
jgi:uncharacterized membrane protein